jgi:hypothetical protein
MIMGGHMIRFTVTCAFVAGVLFATFAQDKKSVVIGSYIEKPNAVLALNPPDKNQGFLLPQLSSQERLSITPKSPAEDGLIVYDLNEKSFYYWKENAWMKGLGADRLNDVVTFNETSNVLVLANGEAIDLSSLKELPASNSQQAGMYLATDGSTLSWKPIALIEDQALIFDQATNRLSISKVQGAVDLSHLADRDKTNQTGVLIGNGGTVNGISGTASGQILKWNGTAWVADFEQSAHADNTTIQGDGSIANAFAIKSEGITSAHISTNGVGSDEIAPGAVGMSELSSGSVSTSALQSGAVTNVKLAANSVARSNLIAEGSNKVLTTDASGIVQWSDRSQFTDSQNLTLSGNTLNIERGAAANLNTLTVGGGIISGTLNALAIVDGSVTTNDLGNAIVTTTKIASGGNNKVLTTDATGNVAWTDKAAIEVDASISNETITAINLSANQLNIAEASAIQTVNLNTLALSGDVSGALNTNVVTKIQGQEVQAGIPTDGKILKWQSGKWSFGDDNTASTLASIVNSNANIDVAEFKETNDPINENEHNIYRVFGPTSTFGYMSKRDRIKDIVAGIHVPHGAQMTQVTGYFWDNEANGKEVELKFMQKELSTGTLTEVASRKTIGAAASVQSVNVPTSILVDNSRYIYFVQVHFDLGPDDYVANKLDLINQRIYGVTYSYIEPANTSFGPGVNQTIYVNATAPLTPFIGQVWLDTTTNILKYWNGLTWIAQQ